MRNIYAPIDLVAEGLAVGEHITEHVGREVLIITMLPPVQGTVTGTHVGKSGRLWLHIADADGTEYEHTLGDVIFL